MTPTVAEGPHTPEEMLKIPDGHRYELIDGNLVKRAMGAQSSLIAATLIALLMEHVQAKALGYVFATDCGYQIFAGRPKRVRIPDGSFVARGRLPNDRPPLGHIKVAPDLAIEVISPRDSAYKVEEKIEDYLAAGVKLMWVVYPNTKRILIYRLNGPITRLGTDDELSGDDVIAGFRCRVADLFANV